MSDKTIGFPLGWHSTIPNDAYHADPAVSASQLNQFRKSPLHYHHARTTPPKEQTPAMKLGSAVHAMIDGSFDAEFVEAPAVNRRTKAGKETWNAFVEKNAHRTVLTPEQVAQANAISDSLMASPFVANTVIADAASSAYEISGFWVHEETGIKCRIRPDWMSSDWRTHINWKVTANAEPFSFPTHAFKFGYIHSVGFYELGMLALNGHGAEHWLAAVENAEPYCVVPFRIPQPVVDWAVEEVERLIWELHQCQTIDVWPGYRDPEHGVAGAPVELYPPNWAVHRKVLQEDYVQGDGE